MSNILLIDVDSKIPNIALMKISMYHKNNNDIVDLIRVNIKFYPNRKPKYVKIDCYKYDRIYISVIFSNTYKYLLLQNSSDKEILIGGSGFDYTIKLPNAIEKCECDYSIYPENNSSYGFITRGCIRNCFFCIVPKKEGNIHLVNDYKSIIKHKKVYFLDNNFFAYKEHKNILKELKDLKIRFQFNQGLDIRLVDNENMKLLSECNYMNEPTFAFDDIKYKKVIDKKIKIVKQFFPKLWKIRFFVYVNSNMELKEVVQRVIYLRANKCLIYLMRDLNCYGSEYEKFFIDLAEWCNWIPFYKKMDFITYLNTHRKKERAKKHINLFIRR
jgi:hypothetical protein